MANLPLALPSPHLRVNRAGGLQYTRLAPILPGHVSNPSRILLLLRGFPRGIYSKSKSWTLLCVLSIALLCMVCVVSSFAIAVASLTMNLGVLARVFIRRCSVALRSCTPSLFYQYICNAASGIAFPHWVSLDDRPIKEGSMSNVADTNLRISLLEALRILLHFTMSICACYRWYLHIRGTPFESTLLRKGSGY
jgi:hypothetical protein